MINGVNVSDKVVTYFSVYKTFIDVDRNLFIPPIGIKQL